MLTSLPRFSQKRYQILLVYSSYAENSMLAAVKNAVLSELENQLVFPHKMHDKRRSNKENLNNVSEISFKHSTP